SPLGSTPAPPVLPARRRLRGRPRDSRRGPFAPRVSSNRRGPRNRSFGAVNTCCEPNCAFTVQSGTASAPPNPVSRFARWPRRSQRAPRPGRQVAPCPPPPQIPPRESPADPPPPPRRPSPSERAPSLDDLALPDQCPSRAAGHHGLGQEGQAVFAGH